MTVLQDIYQLKPENLITFYELDLTNCIGKYGKTIYTGINNWANNTVYTVGTLVFYSNKYYQCKTAHTSTTTFNSSYWSIYDATYRWCDGVSYLGNDIVWNSKTYERLPIQASGFDKQGNGTIPRPKLVLGNYNGWIADLAREYNDLIGAKLTRTRTFVKYIDSSNFETKNYLTKTNALTDSTWANSSTTISTELSTIPFPVGSKITIRGVIPNSYNVTNATVTASTNNSVSFLSLETNHQLISGTVTGSGYSLSTTNINGNGITATVNFDPINYEAAISNEPSFTVTETNTTTSHSVLKSSNTTTFVAGKTYSLSFYVKLGIRSRFRMELPGSIFIDSTARYAYFDLVTKVPFQTNTIKGKINIQKVQGTTNWYRCSISDTAEVSSTVSSIVLLRLYDGTNYSYTGNSTQPAVTICAPQLTAGSAYPKEYYPEVNSTIKSNPFADPTQYLDKEIWTVDRKANENRAFIELELTAPYDLMGVKIPKRQCIQNVCSWKYRSAECGYTGNNYFNVRDEQVITIASDVCGKRVSSCKLRFPNGQALPYGGFPSVGIY